VSRRAVSAIAVVALALFPAACGGGDEEEPTTTTTPPAPAAPSGGANAPNPSALPPQLLKCFADAGYEITSPAEIHSAPPEVVQECFGSLHGGGGGAP
jgi:hypothetical protein